MCMSTKHPGHWHSALLNAVEYNVWVRDSSWLTFSDYVCVCDETAMFCKWNKCFHSNESLLGASILFRLFSDYPKQLNGFFKSKWLWWCDYVQPWALNTLALLLYGLVSDNARVEGGGTIDCYSSHLTSFNSFKSEQKCCYSNCILFKQLEGLTVKYYGCFVVLYIGWLRLFCSAQIVYWIQDHANRMQVV